MQFDDGKISLRHIIGTGICLAGIICAAMNTQATAESLDDVAQTNPELVISSQLASPTAEQGIIDSAILNMQAPESTEVHIQMQEPAYMQVEEDVKREEPAFIQIEDAVEMQEPEDIQDEDAIEMQEPEDIQVEDSTPIYDIQDIQEKCSKTGITAEPIEHSTDLYFNPDDVTQPSNMTLEQLSEYVSSHCPDWVGLEEHILTLDKHVNLVFLLSVARMETWAGQLCVGDYNCFNIRMGNGDYVSYNNYQESIDDFVDLIIKEYVNPDGLWYEGVSIESIGIHYAQPKWAPGITDLGYEIYEKLV